MPRPALVVVSGPPGSGKTTLAHLIARSFPCPAVCRDEIKEGMVHAHGEGFEPGPGDELTARTFPLFFDVVRTLVEGGVSLVAEAAFQDARWRLGLEPFLDQVDLRIVHCSVALEVSYERAVMRAASDAGRRAAHGSSAAGIEPEDWAAQVASFERVSLDSTSIEVDTTDGYDPELATILSVVRGPVSSGA